MTATPHVATVPRDLKAIAAELSLSSSSSSSTTTTSTTAAAAKNGAIRDLEAATATHLVSAEEAAGQEETRDAYLMRRPWHDDVLRRWPFMQELEDQWEVIRAEFDTLREQLKRNASGNGGVAGPPQSNRPNDGKTTETVAVTDKSGSVDDAGTAGGESSSAQSGLLTVDSSDDELPPVDLDSVRTGGALLPKIHPWPETNLYEQRSPRFVREEVTIPTEDRADGAASTSSSSSSTTRLVDQHRKRRQAALADAAAKGLDSRHAVIEDEREEEARRGQGWDVFGIYAFGKKHHNNAKLCPITTALVEKIPGCSTAAFSILKPGARILPHTGYYGYAEMILRCQLGLHIPADETKVWLQVAGIRRGWQEGKVFVFDDTYEHSAVNLTDQERVVLLLDFRAGRFDAETLAAMAERQTNKSQHEYLNNLVTAYGYGVELPEDGAVR